MGIDPSMADQDPDFVNALLESLLAEEQMAREHAAKMKAEEEEK